jgi:hypothetical protein
MPEHAVSDTTAILDAAAQHARAADVFDNVTVRPSLLVAEARDTPAPVFYRLELGDGDIYVSWNTPDRYLSQSIEADLMWTGDDLDDLIDEELVDLGWERGRLAKLDHYRNDEMLFTFRSKVPLVAASITENDAEDLARCLLAYELAFRELGDMNESDEDE